MKSGETFPVASRWRYMYVMRYIKSIPIKRHLCLQVAKSKYEDDSIKPAGVCSSSLKMTKITCHKIKQLRMTGIGLFIVRLGMFYNATKFNAFRQKQHKQITRTQVAL